MSAPRFALGFLLFVGVSLLCFRWVERPARQWILTASQRLTPARLAVGRREV